MEDLSYVKELSPSRILSEWWQEVKENHEKEFWEDTERFLNQLKKTLMEVTMEEEAVMYTGAQWHERTSRRFDYRAGYRYRDLLTKSGRIKDIKVPRLRKAKFRTKVFKNYQRRQAAVDRALRDVFLAGVSTRRVGEALSALLDEPVSATTVSNVTKCLDGKVKEFQARQLLDEYQYLILDGLTLKVRAALEYKNRSVLVAYGITIFGQRELISFRQVSRETKAKWLAFLDDLRLRGLEGKNLKLITVDGHKGLIAATEDVFPFVPIQRCWAHKLRNVAGYLPKKHRELCISQARAIYNASSKQEAVKIYRRWAAEWKKIKPEAVHCIEKDLDQLLAFFDCPRDHRVKVRTTNVIERSFREVRRRTRTMNCFTNEASCNRIIYVIFNHLNKHWKERPLKAFNQFTGRKRS